MIKKKALCTVFTLVNILIAAINAASLGETKESSSEGLKFLKETLASKEKHIVQTFAGDILKDNPAKNAKYLTIETWTSLVTLHLLEKKILEEAVEYEEENEERLIAAIVAVIQKEVAKR